MAEPRTRSLPLLAIDLLRGTRSRGELPGLLASQWRPAAELREMQLSCLRELLALAAEGVPFYREHAARHGWHPEDFRGIRDLARLPVVRKEDLRREPDAFRPEPGRRPRRPIVRRTGGSTGQPLDYLFSRRALGGHWAATYRAWSWTGYQPGDRMATVGGDSLGGRNGHRLALTVYDRLRNNLSLSAGRLTGADFERHAVALERWRPSLLYGYPSVLYELARHVLRRGRGPGEIARVITTSEMLFAGQRRLIEEAFAAPVFDFYGCNEAGLLAGECDRHQGHHVAMEYCLLEVLDESGQPAPAGAVGRLVATSLLNEATLIVRYDTGDVGALETAPCACGRGLVRIAALEGRSRDLVRRPDGSVVHGVAINHLVYGFTWIDRYQLLQRSATELELRVRCRGEPPAEERERLRAQVADRCGMACALVCDGTFLETAGGKARVVVDLREEKR